jgi:hypothetical protein
VRQSHPVGGWADRSHGRVASVTLPTAAATVVSVVAIAYRVYAIATTVPALGADESIIGIMAQQILAGAQFPAFFLRQHYMGSIEAYLAAPFVGLLGPTTAAVRAGTLLLYGVFYWAMYWTTRRLYAPWFAVVVVGWLGFASDRLLRQQLQANGGHEEVLAFGALLAGVTFVLCRPARPARGGWWYAAWGLLVGLGLWSGPLFVTTAVPMAIAVMIFRWRDLIRWPGLTVVGGVLLGMLPMIVHNLRLPAGVGTLPDVLAYNPQGAGGFSLRQHLHGTRLAIAYATGVCDRDCRPRQLDWSKFSFPLLLAAGITTVVVGLWRSARPGSADPDTRARYGVQLAIAAGAVGTLALYLQSVHSGAPDYLVWHNARYLNSLVLATPVLLWPAWRLCARARDAAYWRAAAVLGVVVLVLNVVAATSASVSAVGAGGAAERVQQARQSALLAYLTEHQIDRLYTDYFTCMPLIYSSDATVLCAAVEPGLRRGYDRWLPFRQAVDQAPEQTFAFLTDSIQDQDLRAFLAANSVVADTAKVAGYTIYKLGERVDLPNPGYWD